MNNLCLEYSTSFSKGPDSLHQKLLRPKRVEKTSKRSRKYGDQNLVEEHKEIADQVPVEDQKKRSSPQFSVGLQAPHALGRQ